MTETTTRLPAYRLATQEVIAELDSTKDGLSAAQAAERLQQYGPNQLQRLHKDPVWLKYLRQFKDLIILLLLASAFISVYLKDRRTATILFVLAFINASFGFFQEHKAELVMESLERLVVPEAKVIRTGGLEEILSTELVPGDIVYLEEGDSVPADLRLIDEQELTTNDFALTGESNPSRKFTHGMSGDVELANRHNLVFMGTTVATGHAHGIVIATGMQTELGRIASLSQETKASLSPLQKEMNNMAKRIGQGTVILATVLVIIALKVKLGIHEALLFGIGISAAMIPNGLPTEVSIALSQAAKRLARARVLVKKLSAVETLGATSIICTDKTGTLTKNQMTVEHMLIGRSPYNVTGSGYEASGQIMNVHAKPLDTTELEALNLFFTTGVFASNAQVDPPDSEHPAWYVVGDPTEGALITLARKAGLNPIKLQAASPEAREFAFDSARKRMSSIRRWGDGKRQYVFVKGAPENVMERCDHIWDHGHVRPLGPRDRAFFNTQNNELAEQAMRNLAFAYKVLPAKTSVKQLKMDAVESDLTLLGMVSMIDPLRDEVKQAMVEAHAAHIKVSIITGDFAPTAKAIARRAGLVNENGDLTVVSGEDLRKLSDAQVLQLATKGGVIFSRVAPEDKLRIVELVKANGKVVAVTGDGINDAPALKRADIGVAMGKTGTDVAKESAEVVLLDDSFHTLVGAIQQGRLTFQNIKKATRCVLTDNAGELMTVLISLVGASAFHVPLAITAVQILAIDLIAELFPVTALGWDPPESELMTDPPRNLKDHIITVRSVWEFILYGLFAAGLAYGNFLLFFARHHAVAVHFDPHLALYAKATILTYLTVVLCQFTNLLIVRSDNAASFFSKYLWSNKKLLIAFGFSLLCILNIMYNPVIRPYFNAGPLAVTDWLYALLAAAIYLCVRLFHRYSNKHHSREVVLELHKKLQAQAAD